MVYDYRQDKQANRKSGRIKPLQSLSAIGFLNEHNTFHPLDKFSLSLANGKTVAYHQCYADVVLLVMKNQFYMDCNMVLPQEKENTLLFSLAQKYGYSPKDRDAIKNLFDKIVPNKSKLTKL